jgi:hypothetical protein
MTKESAHEIIDIGAFIPTETCDVEIKSPKGIKTGWIITIAGNSHPKAIAHNEASARIALQTSAARDRALSNGERFDPQEMTVEEKRADSVKFWISRITGWNTVSINGEVLEFSDAGVQTLVLRPQLEWAFKQVLDALGKDSSFTTGAAKL